MPFLRDSGFEIKVFEGGVMKGLPAGAVYFILIRKPDGSAPAWIDLGALYTQTASRNNESRRVTTVWDFVIWMQILSSLYTANKRSPLNISDYGNPNNGFTNQNVITGVQAFLDDVLQRPPDQDTQFIAVLRKHTKTEVQKRINGFLGFLCSIGHLKKLGKDDNDKNTTIYQQTLLGAVEVAEHHRQGLNHLVPPAESPFSGSILKNLEQTNIDNVEIGDL